MLDIFLLITILALISLIGLIYYLNIQERSKLINAVVAKHSTDLVNTTLADQSKIEVKKEPEQQIDSDLLPLSEATDDQFQAMINEENRLVDQQVA